jgi:arylsulfatase A-like enzyme/Tfp pilus assembly protein PilF
MAKKRRKKKGIGPAGRGGPETETRSRPVADDPVRRRRPKLFLFVAAAAALLGILAAVRLFTAKGGGSVARGGGRNVLLITLDTTRADRIGCYGYAGASTPNLDALAAAGVRFENAYCPVPLTLPSHASILTGMNPVRHGVHNNGTYTLTADKVTLAEILKDRGYETAAFTAAFSVDSRFGLDQGFDVYDDDFLTGSPFKPVNAERRADKVHGLFASCLGGRKGGPFFAWVHFYDPHLPYEPPKEFLKDFAGRPYDGEVAYMDKYVGEVIRAARDKGSLENTLVVIAGDHGEAFGEKVETGHGIFLYEMSMRVPLIFYSEGGLPAGLVPASTARLIDIMPTVLDLLEIKTDARMDGRSLVPVMEGRRAGPSDVYIETFYPRENWGWSELVGLISAGWKYIQAPRPELYDLAADPGEERNVFGTNSAKARDMKSRLEAILAASAGIEPGKRELSAAEQETLRSLGYVQFSGGSGGGSNPDPKDMVEDLRLFQRAGELDSAGDHAGAERVYRELLDRAPQVAESYVNLALAQGRQKKFDEAIETLKRGVEAIPGSDILLVRLGHTYLVVEKLPEALEAMQRAVIANPACLDALTVSAIIYERWGRLGDALGQIEQALAIEPENEFRRVTYARLLGMSGRLDEAIEAFSALARDYPGDPFYSQNLGIAYGLKKDYDRAIENLERSLRLQPSPKSYLNLAAAYHGKGRIADAVNALESFLADPGEERPETVEEAKRELARLQTQLR